MEALPAARKKERADWGARLGLLTIQLASDRGEYARVAKAIQAQRSSLPAHLLPQAIYMRLHALRKMKETRAILAAMKKDLGVLAGTDYDAPAIGVYAEALRAQKQVNARQHTRVFVNCCRQAA